MTAEYLIKNCKPEGCNDCKWWKGCNEYVQEHVVPIDGKLDEETARSLANFLNNYYRKDKLAILLEK